MTEISESASPQPATFDTDTIPLGERSWHAILQHVMKVGDEAETSYLETKSTLGGLFIGVFRVFKGGGCVAE